MARDPQVTAKALEVALELTKMATHGVIVPSDLEYKTELVSKTYLAFLEGILDKVDGSE